jgi:phthalate 4,5-dioxygenase
MLTRDENDILTGVGPGTAMHDVLAAYWYPVARSADLGDRETLRVRLLGENWVVARRGDDLIALEEGCPHRQASLALARVEDCGLRCIYHGWLVGDDGHVVESPNERETESRRDVAIRRPEIIDAGGLIWLNVADQDAARCPVPAMPWFDLPHDQYAIADAREPANWVQAVEGGLDSSHSSFLHSDEIVSGGNGSDASTEIGTGKADAKLVRPSADGRPRIRVADTDFGFVYAALRVPLVDPEEYVYVRATPFAMPSFVGIPAADVADHILMWVPVDEFETHYFIVRFSQKNKVDQDWWERWTGLARGIDLTDDGFLRASKLPGWGQDRKAMRDGTSFTGLRGVNLQDFVVQQSMGGIVDRTKEHLGPADRAVIHFRRTLLEAAEGKGIGDPDRVASMDYSRFYARDAVVPINSDWKSIYADMEMEWHDGGN